jgi:hypothetical protein
MGDGIRKITRTMFEPGRYSSRSYQVNEHRVDVHLPAPDEPFNVLRFKILDGTVVTVYFDGPAEVRTDA